jgi:hypothetical protein
MTLSRVRYLEGEKIFATIQTRPSLLQPFSVAPRREANLHQTALSAAEFAPLLLVLPDTTPGGLLTPCPKVVPTTSSTSRLSLLA